MRIFQLNLIVHQAIPNLLALRANGYRTTTSTARRNVQRSLRSQGSTSSEITDIYICTDFLLVANLLNTMYYRRARLYIVIYKLNELKKIISRLSELVTPTWSTTP